MAALVTYCNDKVTLILELLQRMKTFAAISGLIIIITNGVTRGLTQGGGKLG